MRYSKNKTKNWLFCRSSEHVPVLQEQGGEMTLMSGILMSMRGQRGFLLSFIGCDIHLILHFYRLVSTHNKQILYDYDCKIIAGKWSMVQFMSWHNQYWIQSMHYCQNHFRRLELYNSNAESIFIQCGCGDMVLLYVIVSRCNIAWSMEAKNHLLSSKAIGSLSLNIITLKIK